MTEDVRSNGHDAHGRLTAELRARRDRDSSRTGQVAWLGSLDQISRLTAREREVLGCLASGATNLEIADSLCISERTVRAHLTSLLDKLRLESRLQACMLGAVQQLLSAPVLSTPVLSTPVDRDGRRVG